jgi:putative flippase GtrA
MPSAPSKLRLFPRWIKFNAVGALGFLVQLSALWLFIQGFKIGSLTATALAVELAILHNFVWHNFVTWKDRPSGKWHEWLVRLLTFNATNGAVSLTSNVVLAYLIVEGQPVSLLAANLLAICACSLINFALSDRIVFRLPPTSSSS